VQQIPVLGHEYHRASPQGAADSLEGIEVQRRVQHACGQKRRRRATWREGLELAPAGDATAKLQHLPDSAAPGHAMDAGPGNIARDTDELEPLVAWLALRRPPVRAVPADGGNRGEGLDEIGRASCRGRG